MSDKKELAKVIESLDGQDGKELIKALIKNAIQSKENRNSLSPEETIKMLETIREDFYNYYEFKEGDIVTWKANVKNRTTPDYGEPAIIMEILAEPIYGDKQTGSTYFNEPLDIVLGTLAEGELRTFHYDSRKFRPFVSAQANQEETEEEREEEN